MQIVLFSGCSQEQKSSAIPDQPTTGQKQIGLSYKSFQVINSSVQLDRKEFESADLRILFVGNSHTRTSPEYLGQLLRQNTPKPKILIARSMGGFLVDHLKNNNTNALLDIGKWDFVILQAQKYSTSGKYIYPIDGAIELADRATTKGSTVVMFPEWSRRDHPDEFKRINSIHKEIAKKTGAVVAPIGKCWQAVAKKIPQLGLYHADGNHASPNGHFVNACVFYELIRSSQEKINLEEIDSSNQFESQIAKIVWEQLRSK